VSERDIVFERVKKKKEPSIGFNFIQFVLLINLVRPNSMGER